MLDRVDETTRPVNGEISREDAAGHSREEKRKYLADQYLTGYGIEIGALHMPLAVPTGVSVKYVDRYTTAVLREKYPELKTCNLVKVDIVDDGEMLDSIVTGTQDFVIANHFLEHCENPVGAVKAFFRVLKNGGILYLAMPDKRFTFDKDRPLTPLEHIKKDYEEGPFQSRANHFREWAELVDKDREPDKRARFLMKLNYSIHFHVWTQTEVMEMLVFLKRDVGLDFEVKEFAATGIECICVMQKA